MVSTWQKSGVLSILQFLTINCKLHGVNGTTSFNTNPWNNSVPAFDLQSFLDPQVIQSIIPLPIPVINPPPKTSQYSELQQRQLSLAPTTAFISRRSFNTSCAFTIPLVTFVMPTAAPFSPDSTPHIANQMVYSLFFFLYSVACFIVPVVFSGIRDPTITGRSESDTEANIGDTKGSEAVMNRLLQPQPLVDFMGTGGLQRVGLDGRKCLLKTICVANQKNNGYGVLALPFKILYPPAEERNAGNGTRWRPSPAQIAAGVGAAGKKDCDVEFPCLLDVLDVASYLRDWWVYSSYSDIESER